MTAPIRLTNLSVAHPATDQVAAVAYIQTTGEMAPPAPGTRPAPVTQYPAAAQFDLRVTDHLINRVARRGDFLRCIDLERAGNDVRDGDLVVIALHDSNKKARLLVRRMRRLAGRIIFSHDSAHQDCDEAPILASDDDSQGSRVTIIAKALFAWSHVAA